MIVAVAIALNSSEQNNCSALYSFTEVATSQITTNEKKVTPIA